MNQLKTQIMTMFMMKSSQSAAAGKKSGGYDEIFMILYSMMIMNLFEFIFKHAPVVGAKLMEWVQKKLGKKIPKIALLENVTQKKEDINSVTLVRFYGGANGGKPEKSMDSAYTEKVDAIIDHLCSIDNSKHVRMDTRCSVNSTDEIELTPLLRAKVKSTLDSAAEEGGVVEIVIFSIKLKVSEIRGWIDEIHNQYCYEKSNKLGNKNYYFNEIPQEPVKMMEIDGGKDTKKFSYRWENAPKALMFSMNEFKTSKSFANVYGTHVGELRERLELFLEHPEWYMERGIPHSLGIMLHGVPGAGKTSTIKAIAKDTGRHIFNLSLRPYTSQRQLNNLFFNENVVVQTGDGQKQTLKIPLNKRVYVIEDIDCLTDIVLDRALVGASRPAVEKDKDNGEAVTLSFLLNLLDGVLETPGRILVITSNYPEKLDRALIRPGRIDVKISFTNASRTFVHEMIERFYSCEIPLDEVPVGVEGKFTPAEVMESCCTYFKDYKRAIAHLIGRKPDIYEEKRNVLLQQQSNIVSESAEIVPTKAIQELVAPTMEKSVQENIDDQKVYNKEDMTKLIETFQVNKQDSKCIGFDNVGMNFASTDYQSELLDSTNYEKSGGYEAMFETMNTQ